MAGVKKRKKNNSMKRVVRYLSVLLSGFLIVALVAIITNGIQSLSAGETAAVDPTVVEMLKSLEDRDVGEVVSEMAVKEAERQSSIAESIAISESESRSIELSSMMAESSMEEESRSIAESIYASSVEESSRAAEEAQLNAGLQGSHLRARHVAFNCDDTDIPYLRDLFSHCVVIGNSRAKNCVDAGVLSDNEVKYQSGVSVDVFTPFALHVAQMYYPKTLIVMGLNDIGHYDGNENRFYEDYLKLVQQYKSINPGSKIYLSEILPCPEEARPYFYRFFMIPKFNAKIKQVCEETGSVYVSASPYADFKYITSQDHAHYGKEFYLQWCQTMATQMHLWEDRAGLGYEIPYDLWSDPELPVLENTVTETDVAR